MPLMIEAMRAEFSHYLNAEPHGQRSIDDALRHVLTMTYQRGLHDAKAAPSGELMRLAMDLLDPEMYGHAVTQEVRNAARRAIQRQEINK
jgi:hypothetical protein